MTVRKIIHIDMDAFYASVEQRDNPAFRGRPLAVGSSNMRSVVAAASYEARRYGIRSSMPSKTALRRCPHLIFVPPRFNAYIEASEAIMRILLEYTELVEPLSLDEAFLDVTSNSRGMPAVDIAGELKARIRREVGLIASAGVSINKFIAKIASDCGKPDGLFVVLPKQAERFVEGLKIEQFYCVGKATTLKMHALGVRTGADLKRLSQEELVRNFGRTGLAFYDNARAIDKREVTPGRLRKSVGAENTFEIDLAKSESLTLELCNVARRVWDRIAAEQFYGRTLTLKVKYEDFTIITRSKTIAAPFDSFDMMLDTAKEMLENVDTSLKKVRLIGLTMSNEVGAASAKSIKDGMQLEIIFEEWGWNDKGGDIPEPDDI
ncbi:MAG: DNA polymerase IV [Tannerellaceae bacterium]|jgi:DNA polymerase-4|nr:DNA polymerase IV [Tannerellaceae bacterium]